MATFIPNVTDIFPEPSLFTPDFSFMDKMLQRRKSMYDQGFAQVNSAYNFINRETTNPYNSKVKDQFLKQAKDNLKNLSSMDLSQFQNVDAANSVFSPFYKNREVVGDQTLTEHWNREIALGNSFKTKDGGKDFNQTNIDYILQQKNWFAQDTPDTWSEYWGSKRTFTPYYDATKEIQEAMKNFKPSHVKTANINGFYINVVDDKSWYNAEVSQYLNAVLSDKAKQQWRIEGAVKYGDNPALLSQTINSQASTLVPDLQTKVDDLNIRIRQEKDPTKAEQLTKERDGYIEKQNTLNDNLTTISNGDLKFLRRNSEKLAYEVYYNEKMKDITEAFSHKDIEQDIKFNDIAKMFWENDQKWALETWKRNNELDDRQFDANLKIKLAQMTADAKTKEGQLPLLTESGKTVPVTSSFSGLTNAVELLAIDANNTQADLKKQIVTVMKMDPGHAVTDREFNAYVKTHGDDPLVMNYVSKHNAVQEGLRNLANFNRNANTYVAEQMGETKWKAYMNLSKAVKAGKSLDPKATAAYNNLKTAYDQLYGNYHNTNYTVKGVSTMGYGLNTADKRFKEAAGGIANYTGLDASLIGSVSFMPTLVGGTDMKFTIQVDPNKPTWKKSEADAMLKAKLPGSKIEWDGNTVTIRNAPAEMTSKYDPYVGLDYATRFTLNQIQNHDAPGGTAEFFIPMRTKEGFNVSFRVLKQKLSTQTNYYLLSDRGNVLTDGSSSALAPYTSTEELGQNLKTLTQQFDGATIKKMLNQ